MRDVAPRRCGLKYCTSGLPGRPYPCGDRCERCSPSAVAGEVHPDQIAAISRANRAASLAASTTTSTAEAA